MGGQRLPITAATDAAGTTNKFQVLLLHRQQRKADVVSWVSNLRFRDVPELQSRGLAIDLSNVIINGLSKPLVNSAGVPSRGAKEKDESFFNTLILSLTNPGDVVVDLHAGTCENFSSLFQFLFSQFQFRLN